MDLRRCGGHERVPKKRKAKITVKVFLDSSVLLSASASEKGASRYVIENAKKHRWQLVSSHYCREETFRNLSKLGAAAEEYFGVLICKRIKWVPDTLTTDKIMLFPKAKDKPVLLSAIAFNCETLLTSDRTDFHGKLGKQFYGMSIRTPGDWLLELRTADNL